MSLLNVGAGPRTSEFLAGCSGALHPLITSAPATVRTRAALIRTLGNIMAVLGFTNRGDEFNTRLAAGSGAERRAIVLSGRHGGDRQCVLTTAGIIRDRGEA
jgi:hypothetical protein